MSEAFTVEWAQGVKLAAVSVNPSYKRFSKNRTAYYLFRVMEILQWQARTPCRANFHTRMLLNSAVLHY